MEPVVERLEIQAFRGIKGLVLDDLSTINILAGVNNSGKTSVLEAIRIISAPYNMGILMNVAFSRISSNKTFPMIDGIKSLFRKEKDYIIEIEAKTGNESYSFRCNGSLESMIDYHGKVDTSFLISCTVENRETNSYFRQSIYVMEDSISGDQITKDELFHPLFESSIFVFGMNYYQTAIKLLSAFIINESKKDLLFLLRTFDPSIEDLSIINDTIFLHSKHSGTLPFFACGTGMQKAVMLAAIIISTQGGVILVDEIDNAMNITAFQEVFRWFVAACRRFQVQAFVTTHSMEAIDSILNCQESSDTDDIRMITLRKAPKTGQTIAKIRTGKEARSDRERFEMELRV